MRKIVKILSKRFFVIASILVLNNCAVNNSMMTGSQIAEIAIPLSFESQKRKIQKYPNNQLFYLNASKSRIIYAYGILMEKADRLMYTDYYKSREYYAKSLDLFVLSRNYLIEALELKYKNFSKSMREKSHIVFEKNDIDYLYWLSGSMAGSIQASQADPQYLADLSSIRWLIENAIKIDPDWESGTLSSAMMSVYLNDLSGDKNSEKIALSYFQLAEKQSNGQNASIYVTLAESYAVSKQDKKLYLELLDKALEIDINKDKSLKQSNKLSQSRAKWLKSRVDDLFYM
ncbi:MAG: TRAP transporter TatT component family protein [Candidatus Neomarinimicrobiota bacterium]|tara:strand:- start:774 stop:1637 length:864 start_codon:yes stop_codon:yes gene_type:complete